VQYDLTLRDAIARRYFYVWRDRWSFRTANTQSGHEQAAFAAIHGPDLHVVDLTKMTLNWVMPAAARIAEFCSISLLAHPELIAGCAGVSLLFPATRKSNAKLDVTAGKRGG
jgi:hypothetical protein